MVDLTIAANAAIDLQLHTVFSDGTWSPEALIDHLLAEHFAAAAITDHDRVDIAPLLHSLALEKEFLLLIAVEMSTHWHHDWIDVLCFGFDPSAPGLLRMSAKLLQEQQENLRQTVDAIRQQGFVFPEEELCTILDKPAVQQPHVLVEHVREKGYGTPDRSAGRLLVESGLKQITLDIAEVVDAAHESGGVSLIAHPGRGDGYLVFDDELLDQLRAETAIDGLEVYYPKHTEAQIAAYQAYANRHDLLMSAGSDSHTPDQPPIKYPAGTCRKLLSRLGLRVTGA